MQRAGTRLIRCAAHAPGHGGNHDATGHGGCGAVRADLAKPDGEDVPSVIRDGACGLGWHPRFHEHARPGGIHVLYRRDRIPAEKVLPHPGNTAVGWGKVENWKVESRNSDGIRNALETPKDLTYI